MTEQGDVVPDLVTLGLTAYNAGDTISGALASMLSQDWDNVEIVAVDDASTDGTRDILERAARAEPRLRLIALDANVGVAAARNAILEHARGEFICFFDDDDESAPHRVRRQVARLRDYERDFANGALVACYAARRWRGGSTDGTVIPTMGEDESSVAPSGLAAARRVLAGTPLKGANGSCATCSMLARTTTFRLLGGFDPAFRRSEDTEFFVRLSRAGGHFVGIAEPLVVQTMTHGDDKAFAAERQYHLALLEKHRDLFDSEADYRFSRDWVEMKADWRSRRTRALASRLARLALAHPLRTIGRLWQSLGNLRANRAQRRFHAGSRVALSGRHE